MGRQIRFYMTEEDEDEFVEFMRSTGDVVILPQTSAEQNEEEFPTFRSLAGRRLGESSVVWNRSLSPKPLLQYYGAHGGCYCVDFMQSEVVNVIRSKRFDNRISMGRLHIEDKARLPGGDIVDKNGDFVKWFNKLCRWIKKKYPSIIDGACVSSHVEVLAKSGVELAGHIF